jgi:hypothetical protein
MVSREEHLGGLRKAKEGVTAASITFGATDEGKERMMLEHGPSQLRRHEYVLELDSDINHVNPDQLSNQVLIHVSLIRL